MLPEVSASGLFRAGALLVRKIEFVDLNLF